MTLTHPTRFIPFLLQVCTGYRQVPGTCNSNDGQSLLQNIWDLLINSQSYLLLRGP